MRPIGPEITLIVRSVEVFRTAKSLGYDDFFFLFERDTSSEIQQSYRMG